MPKISPLPARDFPPKISPREISCQNVSDNCGEFMAFMLSVLTEDELQVLSDTAYVINFQITKPMCEILNFEAYRYRGCIAYSSAQVSLRAKSHSVFHLAARMFGKISTASELKYLLLSNCALSVVLKCSKC